MRFITSVKMAGVLALGLLAGAAFLIPIILVYTAYSYWVFRGKIEPGGGGYH